MGLQVLLEFFTIAAEASSQASFAMLAGEEIDRAWGCMERWASMPTQSQAFATALSKTLACQDTTRLLIAEGEEGGNALLPLCRDKNVFSRWRTLGSREVFEPIDVLQGDPRATAAMAHLLSRQGRAVVFDRLPADSPLIPALRRAIKGRGWLSVRPATPGPTIDLTEGWEVPELRFNAGRRSDFRRAQRKAATFGEVSYEILHPDLADFERLFDEAIAVEARSWKREAGSALAVDPVKQAFFRDYFAAMCREKQFCIAFMRIEGQAVAMQMAVQWQDRLWLFKIGYDEAFGKCSPGTLLMQHTIQWAAMSGLQSYELLGDAEPWITELWTKEQRDYVRLQAYPMSALGMLALLQDGVTWASKRLVMRRG